MSRPEAAMEPSMDEILASIRKIIAEEPTGTARPKPAGRSAPAGNEPVSAAKQNPSNESPEPGSRDVEARSPFGMAGPRLMPPREPDAFDKSDPFAAPPASSREPQSSRETQPQPVAAPVRPLPPSHNGQAPAARSAPSADSDVLFGRLAEALRGGLAPGQPRPSPNTAHAPVAAPALPDLNDLEDLLEGSSAGDATSINPPDKGASPVMRRTTVDFSRVVPGREGASSTDGASVRQRDVQGVNAANKAHIEAAPAVLDDDLPDAEESAALDGDGVALEEGAETIDGRQDATTSAGAVTSAASKPEASNATIETEFADLEGDEAAKSAFGALMAGLAASSETPTQAPAVSAGAPVAPAKPKPETMPAPAVAEKSSGVAPADAGRSQTGAGSVKVHTGGATLEVSIEKKPKVVAASLPIAGVGAGAAATSKQVDLGRDATSQERAAAAAPAGQSTSSLSASASATGPVAAESSRDTPPSTGLPQVAAVSGLAATLGAPAGSAVGVRTVEDIVAELLRPMLREWLAENMPRMVEKALRIELAEGVKTVNQPLPPKGKPD